jgi:hypothetical protein
MVMGRIGSELVAAGKERHTRQLPAKKLLPDIRWAFGREFKTVPG